jgi:hypothetical protein
VRWLGTDGVSKSFYSRALCRSNAGCAKKEEGVDGLTRRQSARAHAAQRQKGSCEGHAGCVCPYVGVRVVSWTGGHPGVHAAQ